MNPMPNILRFGWPYLRRYRGRLACGIALGILFGLTNVGFVWATRTVTERLTPPAAVPPAMTGKLPDVGATTPATGALRQAGNVVQKHLDPWLPLHGRKPDWRQILGGLLLLPLMIGARGFAGYLGSYCLAWVSERVVNDLRVDVVTRLSGLSLEFFNRSKLGDLITRINTDTASLRSSLSDGASVLITEPVAVIGIIGYL